MRWYDPSDKPLDWTLVERDQTLPERWEKFAHDRLMEALDFCLEALNPVCQERLSTNQLRLAHEDSAGWVPYPVTPGGIDVA